MLTAAECTAKAAELTKQAETAEPPEWRANLLAMAEQWLELSRQADQQGGAGDSHRIR